MTFNVYFCPDIYKMDLITTNFSYVVRLSNKVQHDHSYRCRCTYLFYIFSLRETDRVSVCVWFKINDSCVMYDVLVPIEPINLSYFNKIRVKNK
jgi:hypothetical protein